jgi:30S ribosomal protein S31
MGKGDRKTRRGKITKGTFGVSRRKKPKKVASENGVPAKKAKAAPTAKSVRAGGAKIAEKITEPVAAAEVKSTPDKVEQAKETAATTDSKEAKVETAPKSEEKTEPKESKPDKEKPKATAKTKTSAKPASKSKEADKKNEK